jgi:hypothetical protein
MYRETHSTTSSTLPRDYVGRQVSCVVADRCPVRCHVNENDNKKQHQGLVCRTPRSHVRYHVGPAHAVCLHLQLIHDVDHVGVPNTQLIKENTTIVGLQGRVSPSRTQSISPGIF